MVADLLPPEAPEHQAARDFARSLHAQGGPGASAPSFRDAWRRAADFGLFDVLIPEEEMSVDVTLSVLEGMGEGCESGGFMLGVGAHCFGFSAPLIGFGDDQQLSMLSGLRDGSVIGALAATEAGAGSDVMSLQTRFRPEGDGYVLNGTKCFITNVREADTFLVLATRDPRLHFRGISAFLVPRTARGVEVGADEPRMGLHGCSIGSLFLDDVVVPRSAVLGRLGGGAAVFQHAMLWERSMIAGAHLGVLRRQLRDSVAYARERQQFGRPIGANQYVAGRLVEILIKYTTARLLVRDTVARLFEGSLTPGEASLAKLYVSEAVLSSGLDAFRVHGGVAFTSGSSAGVSLIDALGGIIYSGTSDIQKVIIADQLGLMV